MGVLVGKSKPRAGMKISWPSLILFSSSLISLINNFFYDDLFFITIGVR